MVRRAELIQKINEYAEMSPPSHLEALFLLTFLGGFKLSRDNIWLRYGTEDPVELVLSDLSQWNSEIDQATYSGLHSEDWKTQDTQEDCAEVIRDSCVNAFNRSTIVQLVERDASKLTKPARRMILLMIRDGEVLTHALRVESEWRKSVNPSLDISGLSRAYQVIFQQPFDSRVMNELVTAGLLYRNVNKGFAVPPFAIDIWPRLSTLCALPMINVVEVGSNVVHDTEPL